MRGGRDESAAIRERDFIQVSNAIDARPIGLRNDCLAECVTREHVEWPVNLRDGN